MAMLSISGFMKKYPSGFEVRIDHLELQNGIHLILGENGSGKSTLLKALAGIHPAKGNIYLNGIALTNQPLDYRKKIGYAEAEPSFPSFLNLEDLISVVAKAKSGSPHEVQDLKNLFGVESFSGYPVGTFSSGMLKKAALLLAFIGEPELLILDEPFTTIDIGTQQILADLIIKKTEEGKSFLITSHQAGPLDHLPIQSVLRMKNGKLEINE